ncbi:MAG: cytochrome c biogenesis heme-transporting ATPase CcmA [Aquabacterium sp.]|uniref:cytochrome c biogenesis heme-transporting ATPase CcmA n=1 Tax=Aquabacterium sp. TaxID=1872578 RepID=UPI003BBF3980
MTLQACGLTYARGRRKLFSGLDFSVQQGEALRVAGGNGSGKTSLLSLLCGLADPQQGEVRWKGRPIRRQRDVYHRELVYLGHRQGLKDDLSALENLQSNALLAGRACSRPQALQALDALGLASRAHQPVRSLSQGQRRRVLLARLALKPSSPLLILDEPFTALDQESVDLLLTVLNQHLQDGGSVVYTTHQPQRLQAKQHHELFLGQRVMSEEA